MVRFIYAIRFAALANIIIITTIAAAIAAALTRSIVTTFFIATMCCTNGLVIIPRLIALVVAYLSSSSPVPVLSVVVGLGFKFPNLANLLFLLLLPARAEVDKCICRTKSVVA